MTNIISRHLLIPVLIFAATSSALAQSSVPVLVGGEPELDACGSNGVVEGLDPNGDNFLSVRASPSSRGRETDRLNEGDGVYMCDGQGHWIGIVYGAGTCGVTMPIADRKPYRGGCKSGWVFDAYVRLYAG